MVYLYTLNNHRALFPIAQVSNLQYLCRLFLETREQLYAAHEGTETEVGRKWFVCWLVGWVCLV